jgi:hypothetical protein
LAALLAEAETDWNAEPYGPSANDTGGLMHHPAY